MDKWRIIKKELKDLSISAIIVTNNTEEKRITMEEAIMMARNDKIENATAILNTASSKYVLSVEGGLKNIETVYGKENHLEIICRLLNSDNKCIGYKVKDSEGKVYKLSLAKVWELALKDNIVGIRAVLNNNRRCIISKDDYKLSDIPVLTI